MFNSFGVLPSELEDEDPDRIISILVLASKENASKNGQQKSEEPNRATIENTPPRLWAMYGLR